jgi:DNA polymerase delta subunit 1
MVVISTPYEVDVKDIDDKIEIRLWCLGYYEHEPKKQETFLFRVTDFQTHVYAEVMEKKRNILTTESPEIIRKLIFNPEKYNLVMGKTKVDKMIPIFYFQNNQRKPYVKLYFSSLKGKKTFCKAYNDEEKTYRDYENKRDIKYKFNIFHGDIKEEWIFFTEIGLRPCQSFKISEFSEVDDKTRVSKDYIKEYFIGKNSIQVLDMDNLYLGNPRVLSYDIECLSKDGVTFPKYFRIDDRIFLITCYINDYNGKEETGRKVALHLGRTGIKIEGAEVIEFDNEEGVLQGFMDLMEEEKVHIILGFNNLAFDNYYINSRLELLMKKYSPFGHLKYNNPYMSYVAWGSSAYQGIEINYLHSPGLIVCDLLTEIKRNFKFRKYTLNDCSKNLLGDSKIDITFTEMFRVRNMFEDGIWNEYVRDLTRKTIDYGIQDAILPFKLFQKCGYFGTYTQMSNVNRIKIQELYTRGQRVRSKSMLYTRCLDEGYILTKKPPCSIGKFPGAMVFKPALGIHDLVFCLDYASLYPSIMQCYNLCVTTFIHKDNWSDYTEDQYYKFVVEDYGEFRFIKQSIYEGLYPKVIRELLSARKNTRKKIYELEKAMETMNENDENYQDYKTKIKLLDALQLGYKVSCNSIYGSLGFSGNSDDIFKECKDFISNNKIDTMDREMKHYQDFYLKNVNNVDVSMKEVSLCVTSIGKNLIEETMEKATDNFDLKKIYGDTDSIFVSPINTEKYTPLEAIKLGFVIEEFINDWLKDKPPLKIEFEKMIKMIAVSPKRYSYLNYNMKTGILDSLDKIQTKGLLSTRRDNSIWQQETFLKVICAIMENKDQMEVRKIVIKEVYDLMKNKVDIKKLTISSSCKEEYASQNNPIAIFKEYSKQNGRELKNGERFEYVMVCVEGFCLKKDKIGKLIRSVEEYEESQETDNPYKIYYRYYLEKKLKNSVDQIFGICFPEQQGKEVIVDIIKTLNQCKNEEEFLSMCEDILGTRKDENNEISLDGVEQDNDIEDEDEDEDEDEI